MTDDSRSKLAQLIKAAKLEDWDTVDEHITDVTTEEGLTWASTIGLDSENPHVRDLGATIIQNMPATTSFPAQLENKMFIIADTDSNKYVRFRLAMAFWNRGRRDSLRIRGLLEQALSDEDEDIAAMANTCFNQLEKRAA